MDTEMQNTDGREDAPVWAPTPTPMLEPTPTPVWAPTNPAPIPTASSPRRRGIAGMAAALVGVAALASGGTVGALAAAGALDHPAVTVVQADTQARSASALTPVAGSTGGSPVTASSGANDTVVNAASRVSPAVVTIVSSTSASTGNTGGTGSQGQDPSGNGQNPFGQGQDPSGNGQDPFGQGNGGGNGTTPTVPNQGNGGGQTPTVPNQGDGSGSQNLQPYGIPQGQTPVSIGSGVIFDANGWILTNHHVVADAGNGTLTVQLSDGRSFPAKVYGSDTLTDLAIVKIDATGLPVATLGDSSALQVGQLAIAVGDPLGEYPGTVTTGVVSGIGRSISDANINLDDLIQTDAAINPGNSGGPLVDETGAVIGIDTAIAGSAQGIGFAIPINVAKPIMAQALAGQVLSRPWLGIRYTPLDAGIATRNSLSVTKGAWITAGGNGTAVEAGSPAATAGLQENDVITAVDGTAVDTNHPLIELLGSHAPGETVTLTVRRGGADTTVQVTLTTRQASTNN
jgi:serine protease Do